MKLSSYQKLKKENLKLKREIRTLVDNPESIEAFRISQSYKFEFDTERIMLNGDRNSKSGYSGFIDRIVFGKSKKLEQ